MWFLNASLGERYGDKERVTLFLITNGLNSMVDVKIHYRNSRKYLLDTYRD